MGRTVSARSRSVGLLFVMILLAACAGSDAEDCRCDAGACPPQPDVVCPAAADVSCPTCPDTSCPGCVDVVCPAAPDVVCPGVPDVTCPPVPDVVCPSCPDLWQTDVWQADAADPSALPSWPTVCTADEDCRPSWLENTGVVGRCEGDGECAFALDPETEPANHLASIFHGALVYLQEEERLDEWGRELECGLPVHQSATPLEGTCCADLGGPDSDGDDYCDNTRAYWDVQTWNALGFGLGEEPHRYFYEFDSRDLLLGGHWLRIRATTELSCDPSSPVFPCLMTVTMLNSSFSDTPCTMDWPSQVTLGFNPHCPILDEAGIRVDYVAPEGFPVDPLPESLVPRWDEVSGNLAYLANAAVAYYEASGPDCHFPLHQGVTPLEGTCCHALGGPDSDHDDLCEDTESYFDRETWNALGFVPEQPHRFTYEFRSYHFPETGYVEVAAYADQDCNNIQSTFRRFIRPVLGAEGCQAEVVPGFYSEQETE